MKRRLITSALPYVNNVPHLGNLIQVLSADVFARFCRLRGYETLYVCGTDEYGTATETRAAEEGISPRELCDRFWAIHNDIYSWFHIGFDKFGRTSTPIQTEVTQDIFKKLDARGYIVERTIEQLYCASCKRFLADRYVRGVCPHCGSPNARGDQCEDCGKLLEPTELKDPHCSSCGATPSLEKTRHLYIDLPKIKDRLEEWIKTASVKGFWANNAVRMTEAWIRDGLHERAITRDLKWGIPVPKEGFENKVFYVWFDAPIGYISITGNLGDEHTGDWRKFLDYWWKSPDETELFQFIGKDNIPFHTVIFPSSLLGSGDSWTMLHHMSSTEYLNYESGKFSKSRGIGVFGTDVMETGIPADVWRFYIFYNRPEKSDSLFTWKDFGEKVNSELIGNLGNLVNRTLSFVTRYYGGKIPVGAASLGAAGSGPFWDKVREYEKDITEKLDRADERDAFRAIFELSSFANKTFQDAAPWKKRTEDPPSADALIRDLSYVVRDLAVLIQPYMPQAAEQIASFFGLSFGKDLVYKKTPAVLSWDSIGRLEGLGEVVKSEVLFAKLEDDRIAELRDRYSGSQKERAEAKAAVNAEPAQSAASSTAAQAAPEVPLEPVDLRFAKTMDLRVAKIVKIERHPKADKLYIETLEIAGADGALEERIIVSGLVPFYKEEELLNKHIIVAYNLKPAKLRGIESRGMLLAASDHKGPPNEQGEGTERVEVLDAGDTPTGTRVALDGLEARNVPEEIDIDTFFSIPIEVKDNTVAVGGRAFALNGKPVRTVAISQGEVH
ncbi:methionine--tRNA ligase [Leadbettera azotonutricia]|uniref:Methionine--tRNA ligase n=1 Tax=Leadbettera azotonutricia (strain ATCC BAA-888 / DSM 13862 / ZAS-9) TaxID=545695 RepID=F5YDM5_LEAAZ|nr:methionine--tRNA ligase [Leadbettera azotonutricia]AEF80516.1 methionine--tRNA ligase [Leadbettera azotonutricia ZAS-9]